MLLAAFITWLWKDVISHYFKDWKKNKKTSGDISLEALEDE